MAWQSFVAGIGDIFGMAPIRRPVEEPEEAFCAVSDEIRQAIEVARSAYVNPVTPGGAS